MTDFQQQVQFQMPSPSKLFTPAVTVLLVLMVIGYTLVHYATDFTLRYIAVSKTAIFSGKIWQLITYSFVNGCVLNFVFNLFIVLFIGSMVERVWRTRGFLFLVSTTCVACGLVWILISLILNKELIGIGTESISYGLIAAFGILFRKQRFWFFFFITEAQTIALIMIGIGVVINIPNPVSWIWILGALISYLYIKARWSYLAREKSPVPTSEIRNDGFVDID